MGKVIYLPFEHIPQRYTEMWNAAFIGCMTSEDLVLEVKSPPTKIENGQFLDTYGTIIHKAKQMAMVSRLFQDGRVQSGDVFFVPDIFYPGLESIKYMAELSGIDVKIVAFNHAGRADKDDFVQQLGPWSDYQEQAWHDVCDIVLVGSNYHADRVHMKFRPKKIAVTGAIWSKRWMDDRCLGKLQSVKEDYVIWPHRICKEKGFDLFLQIAKGNPELRFVVTSCGPNRWPADVVQPKNVSYLYDLTKDQYFEAFQKAKCYLSTAYQETFGYTLQEAIYFQCLVLVPDYACYPEFTRKDCRLSHLSLGVGGLITELYKFKHKGLAMGPGELAPDNAQTIYDICKSITV